MIRPALFSDEVSQDFPDSVRLSAEAGAAGLELRGRLFGRSITQIDADDVSRIRAVCRRHSVEVAVLGSPVGKCSTDDLEDQRAHHAHFRRMIELAEVLETPLVRGFALWRPGRDRATDDQRPDLERFLPRIAEFLGPIVDLAGRAGVRFCLELEGATMVGTGAEARRVLDALGNSSALGVTWDVNNGLSCGEPPLPDGYDRIRGRVYHVHVKPNPEGSLATVGDSTLTYEEVFETLRADGYQGWASIEHWGSPAAMLEGVRELRALLDGFGWAR